jgi:hypothetical protein
LKSVKGKLVNRFKVCKSGKPLVNLLHNLLLAARADVDPPKLGVSYRNFHTIKSHPLANGAIGIANSSPLFSVQ